MLNTIMNISYIMARHGANFICELESHDLVWHLLLYTHILTHIFINIIKQQHCMSAEGYSK